MTWIPKFVGSLAGYLLAKCRRKKPATPKAWVFLSYHGGNEDAGSVLYYAVYQRGEETRIVEHRFHTRKPAEKLLPFFAAKAATIV